MEIDSVAFTAASDLASPSCGPGRCRRSSVEHDSDDELDDILSLCSQREPMPVQSNRSQPPTNGCQLSPRTIARYSGQQSWPNLRTCYRFKRGWTVVVTCDLPAGLVICDYAGITMTKFDWEKKCDELYRKAVETDAMVDIERYNNFKDYSAEVANGQCIDAGKSVNGWGRLLNHSKSCPNLTVRINGGRALFRAKRKLAAGCELFWDYGSEYDYSLGDFRCDCFCPAVDCKTNIRYKFGEKIAKEFRRLSALKAVGLKSDFQIADYFAPFDLAEVEAIAAAAALYVPSAAGLPASN